MAGFGVLLEFLRVIFMTVAWLFALCSVVIFPIGVFEKRMLLGAVVLAMILQHLQDKRLREKSK